MSEQVCDSHFPSALGSDSVSGRWKTMASPATSTVESTSFEWNVLFSEERTHAGYRVVLPVDTLN